MASIGHSITGPRFVETDEVLFQLRLMLSLLRLSQWFDRQKAHLEVLESQLRGLVKAIEIVSKHRSGLSFSDLARVTDIDSVDRTGERDRRVYADR
jgi:sorting nexin-1/2